MKKDSTPKQVFGWIRVNGVLTFGRRSIARESREPSKTEKQDIAGIVIKAIPRYVGIGRITGG